MLRDFRAFVLRGNVVDLAVGVVIGAAFGTMVAKLVSDLITPLIAAVGGKPDFSGLAFELNHSAIRYGDFINAVVAFLLVAAAVFFLVVVPVNRLMARVAPRPPVEAETRPCPECLSDIPVKARRCAFCTAEVASG